MGEEEGQRDKVRVEGVGGDCTPMSFAHPGPAPGGVAEGYNRQQHVRLGQTDMELGV